MSCSRTVLASPTTPSTLPASAAGIIAAVELAKNWVPPSARYLLSVVRNASATCLLEPVRATRNGDAEFWTASPLCVR